MTPPDSSSGERMRAGRGIRATAGIPGSVAVGPAAHRRAVSGLREPDPGPDFARWRFLGGWPLLVILAVQAALSLRLLWADTAFQDEATYLWAGHLEWAHWLHGAAIPPFASFFSGAPVLYPPVAALADNAGGLAAARILSLAFMLGATALLWGTARRLAGRRAAFFAAALFAVLGPTLHLGAFATYDPLSVFLVALAAWCAVRPAGGAEGTGWMVAAGAVLAAANAAAYSSALFDPVVLVLALLTALPSGARLAARRCAILVLVAVVLLTAGVLSGGSAYRTGIEQTTLARVAGASSPQSVLAAAWSWTGLVFVLAACGVIISWASRHGWLRTLTLAALALAVLLGPLEQARLHTSAALDKHVVLGAWFAAVAAGYAVDRVIAVAAAGRMQTLTSAACVLALAFPVGLGAGQSRLLSTDWPNASSFVAIFRPLADRGSGHLLVEDAAIARYYLPAGSQWQRWSTTRNIVLPSGASTGGPASTAGVTGDGNAGVFAEFITHGYFSLVALNFTDTAALDRQISADLRHNRHYHIIDVVPYGIEIPPIGQGTYVIWRYEP
jgi:Dolichyl-phosphate-mannose-protein mannosyltransferase